MLGDVRPSVRAAHRRIVNADGETVKRAFVSTAAVVVVAACLLGWLVLRPNRNVGAGPWQPSTATVQYCYGVTVTMTGADGHDEVWLSSPLGGSVPDGWNGQRPVAGEFRRLRDADRMPVQRAEFRSGRESVELTTGLSITCE
jgi:hypothetical protein